MNKFFGIVVILILATFLLSGTVEDEKKKKPKKERKMWELVKKKKKAPPKATPQKIQSKKEQKKVGKYTGELGDFYFYQADLQNVILFFAETYKINVVIDPDVRGKVTVKMKQVPWDQALDVILRQQGLVMVREGKVIRAANPR